MSVGPEALDRLDADPAPVEEFDWTGIPDDVHDRVAEVLSLTDRCCEEVFDLEFRTLVRRLIARAAVGDPNLFRRKAKVENTAVAFVWMIASENQVFRGDFTVKELRGWFGLGQGSSSQRAETIRKAVGIEDPYLDRRLADPTLLHSGFRKSLVERRDRYLAELARLADTEPSPELPGGYTTPMAIAWFPADEWPEARTRLSLSSMARSHGEYSKEIESILREHAAHTVGHLAVAPITLAGLETFAMSRGIHPRRIMPGRRWPQRCTPSATPSPGPPAATSPAGAGRPASTNTAAAARVRRVLLNRRPDSSLFVTRYRARTGITQDTRGQTASHMRVTDFTPLFGRMCPVYRERSHMADSVCGVGEWSGTQTRNCPQNWQRERSGRYSRNVEEERPYSGSHPGGSIGLELAGEGSERPPRVDELNDETLAGLDPRRFLKNRRVDAFGRGHFEAPPQILGVP